MIKRHKNICLLILLFALLFWILANASDEDSFSKVTGPCNLQFPKDHGPHPGYRTEWWYYTGNLKTTSDRSFGYQFTFFRNQIGPPGVERSWPKPPSAWRTQQIYLGHAAVSDISEKRHMHDERICRNALGMADARQENTQTIVYLQTWRLRILPDHHQITVSSDDFSYQFDLVPMKPPIPHGISGYSRKGSAPERASCYYSFTRLKTKGTLVIRGRPASVEGLSWMDHEFSTAPLEPGMTGWDWFSLQLSDGTEAMIYLLREKDGTLSSASSGTYVDEKGRFRHLTIQDLSVIVLDEWKSPTTDAVYPSGWRLKIAPLILDLAIVPNLKDQEMKASSSSGVTYWEGSVSARGTKNRRPVSGSGYVELTGYEKPMDAPM